ncbi:pumilio homolog 12-like protein, partial [Tanacetum coccineum]
PILNEIAGKCYDVATDGSGSCVLQACIEHSQGEDRTYLVAEILTNAIQLAEDPYGFVY